MSNFISWRDWLSPTRFLEVRWFFGNWGFLRFGFFASFLHWNFIEHLVLGFVELGFLWAFFISWRDWGYFDYGDNGRRENFSKEAFGRERDEEEALWYNQWAAEIWVRVSFHGWELQTHSFHHKVLHWAATQGMGVSTASLGFAFLLLTFSFRANFVCMEFNYGKMGSNMGLLKEVRGEGYMVEM